MTRLWPKRHRTEAAIRTHTTQLRLRQLPPDFYVLLAEREVSLESAIAIDLLVEQGWCLTGSLLAGGRRYIRFDIDFERGSGDPRSLEQWGKIEVVSRWDETVVDDLLKDTDDPRVRSTSHPLRIALGLMFQGGL